MDWKLKYKLSLLLVLLILAGCATGGKLKDADEYYKQKKYVPAVLMYDEYIARHSHSAEETIAELKRSESYYSLGVQAYTRKNLPLAERMLYLANSESADKLLDDVHLELADKAFAEGDIDLQLEHYNYIADNIKTSELVPVALLGRIRIFLQKLQRVAAYRDYKRLWDLYPQSAEADSARQVMDPEIPWFLQNSRRNKEAGNYATAIAEFLMYADYPSSYFEEIINEVSETYYLWGVQKMMAADYIKMMEYFGKAGDYTEEIRTRTSADIENLCRQFIAAGDSLITVGRLDEAIASYERCYIVKPGYAEAVAGIQAASELKIRFARADSIFQQAAIKEDRKDYAAAKKLYEEAYKLNNKADARKGGERMENYLRAEKNPQDFALEIIRDYKKGIISRNVNLKYRELVATFGDQVTTSDWKAMFSFGEFKYEVRIDILGPGTNYYFAWRVHLIERSIMPLNKASEQMMKE
ncbi:MAG: hypothetical protein K9N06_10345 [Candidatus Cloacimonetes bacterium]|nr:hypothetical protein [Candidatus Cloacimonadota bacterium]